MTLLELYQEARLRLRHAGAEDPGGEAALLLEHYCGCRREVLLTHGNQRQADLSGIKAVHTAVEQRAAHRPLQYILGRWPFMGLELQVGEGVLIPREDTAVLVAQATDVLRQMKDNGALQGVDLCSGTGAVALALCNNCPGCKITAVEWHDTAFEYLLKNLAAYPELPVIPLRGDVLDAQLPEKAGLTQLDFIVSNPPYIEEAELPVLQAEVLREPRMALDGGVDGLLFYRAIISIWVPRLKPGGYIALEIGETQAEQVCSLLRDTDITELTVWQDLAGLDRAVTGYFYQKSD